MGKLNLGMLKDKLENESQKGQGGSNATYDKLKEGKNVRRVLFPKGDKDSFYSEGYMHFGLGVEKNKFCTCPTTWGKKEKCPVCEQVEILKNSNDKNDKALADSIRKKRRIYVNVIDREDEEEKPKVLSIGATIFKGLLEVICDPDYGDITDFENGRDITITRKGQNLNTEYSVLPKPRTSTTSDTQTAEELDEAMTDLDTLFIRKTYEEIQDILFDKPKEEPKDEGEEIDIPFKKPAYDDDEVADAIASALAKRKKA